MSRFFYTFRQNNSHGIWQGPRFVVVRAETAGHANVKAYESGLVYFDPHFMQDCQCCGTRWEEAWERDRAERPTIHGQVLGIDENECSEGAVTYDCLGLPETVDYVYLP